MATTYYVQKKGYAATTGVGTQANPFNGSLALDAAIDAGTVVDGDTVDFVGTAMTVASEGADWPGPASNATVLSGTTSTGGMFFGTSRTVSSSAANIIFQNWILDMRSITTTTRRQVSAFRAQGFGIKVKNFSVITGDWNYIVDDTTGALRCNAGSSPEDVYENCGITLIGEGCTVEDCTVWGADRFSCRGIQVSIPTAGLGGLGNATTIVRRNYVYGCANNIYVEQTGSGHDWVAGTNVDIYWNKSGPGVWGVKTGLTRKGYNAQYHGNGITAMGNPASRGWVQISANEVYGDGVVATGGGHQDGIGAFGKYTVVRGNYIHDLGTTTNQQWTWNGSNYTLSATAANQEGTGVKTGLSGFDGTSPTTYLGTDGVAGGDFNIDGLDVVLIGNVMRRLNQNGITTNRSNSGIIAFNDIDDTGYDGLRIWPNATGDAQVIGNYAICNNFVRKTQAAPSTQALKVETLARLCLMYNNIFWGSGASINDANILTTTTLPTSRWHKNLFVTGKKVGNLTYPVGVDIATQTPAWTPGTGLSAGSALRGAGSADVFKYLRTTWATMALQPGMQTITVGYNGSTTIQVPQFVQGPQSRITAPHLGPYI